MKQFLLFYVFYLKKTHTLKAVTYTFVIQRTFFPVSMIPVRLNISSFFFQHDVSFIPVRVKQTIKHCMLEDGHSL